MYDLWDQLWLILLDFRGGREYARGVDSIAGAIFEEQAEQESGSV
jgi:hypothetical protein